VPTPTGVLWQRDAHTAAKHDLLRRYVAAWLPILFTTHRRVTYAEGFAGPGIYEQGEPGSPVIALEVVASHIDLLRAHPSHGLDLLFVEEHRGRHQRLIGEIASALERLPVLPANVRVHPPERNDCAQALPSLLTAMNAWGSPMFVVLDSFGGPDIPYSLLQQVAGNRAGEVLVTYGPSFLTRHGENPRHTASGNAAFGGTSWQRVFTQPSDRKWAFLVEQYRQSLHGAGFSHVLSFEMVDETGSQLWLLFGTNNPTGVEKMKNAMWGVDPAYGVRYRDPRDPDQMALDIEVEPDTAPLSRILLDLVAGGPLTLDAMRQYALLETVYRPQQVRGLVQGLLMTGQLDRQTRGPLSGHTLLSACSPPINDAEQLALDV
jgi:three-Cys-motif partner protein